MLLGEFNHTLDTKGRIIIPSKFREDLGDKFIIAKGLDKCLFIYTMNEWDKLDKKLKELPITDSDVRKFVRFFFGGAIDCNFDSQGRVLIPQNLRDYASIKKEIVLIGISSKIELWSKENLEIYTNDNFLSDDLAVKINKYGI